MNSRISLVDGLIITSVAENSQIRIGDTNEISASSDILAVQQLEPTFDPHEDQWLESPFERRRIPFPLFPDEVIKITFHEHPFIKTGPIRVIGVAASSTIHIGSICHMYGQAKIIHIRQLPESTEQETTLPETPAIGPFVPLSLRQENRK